MNVPDNHGGLTIHSWTTDRSSSIPVRGVTYQPIGKWMLNGLLKTNTLSLTYTQCVWCVVAVAFTQCGLKVRLEEKKTPKNHEFVHRTVSV